jgi:hypothetical protein
MSELQPGPVADKRVCEWCEPKPTDEPVDAMFAPIKSHGGWWVWDAGEWLPGKHPSTDVARALEAMLEAERAHHEHDDLARMVRVSIGYMVGGQVWWHSAVVFYSETDNDKSRAMALATIRAIDAALSAREKGSMAVQMCEATACHCEHLGVARVVVTMKDGSEERQCSSCGQMHMVAGFRVRNMPTRPKPNLPAGPELDVKMDLPKPPRRDR